MAETPEIAAAAPASAPAAVPAPAPAPAPPALKPSSPPARTGIPPRYDLDAKWDACLDLSIRRVAYASLAGAFGGLILFRTSSPSPSHREICYAAAWKMCRVAVYADLGLVREMIVSVGCGAT
jgi:hypothetical protein